MFERTTNTTLAGSAFTIGGLIYHAAVRSVRKGHRNAVFAILTSMMQTVMLVVIFYGVYLILPGLRGMAVRGDFLLYIMSGIFMYMVHIKSVSAVASAEGPASPIMQHLPMTTAVSVGGAALAALYIQVTSAIAVLYIYHVAVTPVEIEDPIGALSMLVLAWFSGCAVGMVFLALKPWLPGPVGMLQQFYIRINMFASGKMFVANQLPAHLVAIFAWNPLYHIIDQVRGFIFINYTPLKSEIPYPIIVSLILLVIGVIGEAHTRKHVSSSWGAGR